jgi:hypothetical protein
LSGYETTIELLDNIGVLLEKAQKLFWDIKITQGVIVNVCQLNELTNIK